MMVMLVLSDGDGDGDDDCDTSMTVYANVVNAVSVFAIDRDLG